MATYGSLYHAIPDTAETPQHRKREAMSDKFLEWQESVVGSDFAMYQDLLASHRSNLGKRQRRTLLQIEPGHEEQNQHTTEQQPSPHPQNSSTRNPVAKLATNNLSKGRSQKKVLYSGPPKEELPGGWPAGWVKKIVERQSGTPKGFRRDPYWISPKTNRTFRSMNEVKSFFKALELSGGDEVEAYKLWKHRKN